MKVRESTKKRKREETTGKIKRGKRDKSGKRKKIKNNIDRESRRKE